jgi:hypothetical protein
MYCTYNSDFDMLTLGVATALMTYLDGAASETK